MENNSQDLIQDNNITSPRTVGHVMVRNPNNIAKELLKQRINASPNIKKRARYIHELAKVKKRLSQENLFSN